MSDPQIPGPNDLGKVITNSRARKMIYGTYIVALVGAGGTQVAYAALEQGQPSWLIATVAVLGYLGIPVGGLALANTPSGDPGAE